MGDLEKLREDFPLLGRTMKGHPLVYLDSAASSQKPVQVLEAMDRFYREHYANVHRGAYTLAEEATAAYEEARAKVARFLGAARPEEVVFTRGCTSALNTVAWGWGLHHLEEGDRILLTLMEHHSNIVPWQLVARHTGAELAYLPLTSDYRLDMERLPEMLDERVKVVAVTGMSNVLGTIPPLADVARAAHQVGAICVVDAAQAVPHLPLDVQALGVDFLALAGHKMLGPNGVGALYGRYELLEEMEPFEGGGEMIRDVQLYHSTWNDVPWKFEAGTPPIANAVGLGAAVDYLEQAGMAAVRKHEEELTGYALERLAEVPELTVFGPSDLSERGGVLSFTLADIHAHDLATILDEEGVAVRAGHHCAKPLMRTLGVPATTRASLYLYNTREDVNRLEGGLRRATELFGVA